MKKADFLSYRRTESAKNKTSLRARGHSFATYTKFSVTITFLTL